MSKIIDIERTIKEKENKSFAEEQKKALASVMRLRGYSEKEIKRALESYKCQTHEEVDKELTEIGELSDIDILRGNGEFPEFEFLPNDPKIVK